MAETLPVKGETQGVQDNIISFETHKEIKAFKGILTSTIETATVATATPSSNPREQEISFLNGERTIAHTTRDNELVKLNWNFGLALERAGLTPSQIEQVEMLLPDYLAGRSEILAKHTREIDRLNKEESKMNSIPEDSYYYK